MSTFTTSLREIFDAKLAPYAQLPLDEELALIAEAQGGSEEAKLRLLRQYANGLRAIVAREHVRAGGRDAGEDPEETRANVLIAFMEALAACDGTTRVAARLKGATLDASNTYHLRSSFSVPARTRQRYFQALREAGPHGNAEDKAVELGMSREVFREVRAAFATDSIEGMVSSHHEMHGAGTDYYTAPVQGAGPIATERSYATAEDRLTLERAYAAVDELTLGVIEDAYGYAFYDDDSTPDAPLRDRDPFAGFDPIPDTQIAHLRGMSRSAVQRKRTEGLAAMRVAVGADA
ncbi:DNA binding protein [Microbacterium phage Percival]|uniref:DNA binding protein n=1 Tax=Microbacterium phage Percival TaxID=2201439 RepID=A0A2Z4Q8B9_9CAUD|nr:DNA binding protein [Microbacterium phage Percival]